MYKIECIFYSIIYHEKIITQSTLVFKIFKRDFGNPKYK